MAGKTGYRVAVHSTGFPQPPGEQKINWAMNKIKILLDYGLSEEEAEEDAKEMLSDVVEVHLYRQKNGIICGEIVHGL